MVAIEIAPEYGYVILAGVATAFMNLFLGGKVSSARKLFKVPYPTMYSVDNDKFNCYQRAHQNMLETWPQILWMLAFGGIRFPVISSVAGLVWTVGRIVYAYGYYTFEPKNRSNGQFMYLGVIALLVTSVGTALQLLGVV
eukprot:TRINITY_DN5377_c0_g1_i1.p1 TRINITY_DN5377_c0_g1~~TRINITY_DN5377_c0_g1_i1.p1  ORF type:complete len:140 (-),score=21.78 TRINITY_DN5377_c0_g1_i1:41-460(-)